MPTTRGLFLWAVGAAAALRSVEKRAFAEAPGGARRPANALRLRRESFVWVAASTPCGKDLKFDEELYKDLLAYLKANGADGVVGAGTTGEFPSFSSRSGEVAETAFKAPQRLNIIVCSGTSDFPETIELSQHRGSHEQTDC